MQVHGAAYKLGITQKQSGYQFVTDVPFLSDTSMRSPNFTTFLTRYSETQSRFGTNSTTFSRSDIRSFSASSPHASAALPGDLPCSPGTRGAGLRPAA